MKIKEVEKTVTLAWSPAPQYPILLAAGTAAQQLDASFNTSATLEIYSVDLTDPALDMKLCGVINSAYRFHKLVWGAYGSSGDMAQGYIVGGCDSGNITIYSASKVLNNENGLITTQTKHTGPVRAMDFNSFQRNLLATGASNSEIFIWDMNSTKTPMTPGAATQPLEDIVALAWNKQVQHILGTAYSTRCVVWDLRKNEPIIKLTDTSSKVKWKSVVWNPEVATQLCLASEDDENPVIQLWDLRFATSPIKVFRGHQKGVLSLAWCDQDPDLLISCGKDSKLIVWNPNSTQTEGEIMCELPLNSQWNFDVAWCPRNPFLIASSSFDGHASVYSLAGGQPVLQTSSKIADSFPGMNQYSNMASLQQQQQHHQHPVVELKKPPKWLRRPCGTSFAFGGKLVTFDSTDRTVYISRTVTEPDVLNRAKELEDVLDGNGDVISYCYKKAEIATEPYMKDVWNFVCTQFFKESTKPQMCRLLGTAEHHLIEKLDTVLDSEGVPYGNYVSNNVNAPENETLSHASSVSCFQKDDTIKQDKPFVIKEGDEGIDSIIRDALLLGKVDVAVELCLKEKRMADAIILATAGGPVLLSKVQSRYFRENESPLTDLISAVVMNDWYRVVQTCDLRNWKRILVALITYTKDEEFQTLCDFLGGRLENETEAPFAHNALICYVCSGNINQLIESCKRFGLEDVQELTELALIMKEVTMSVVDREFASLLLHYGELLASQGFLDSAAEYLENINDEEVISLKERIQSALGNVDPYPTKQATIKPVSYLLQAQQGPYNQAPKSIVKPYSNETLSSVPTFPQQKPLAPSPSTQQPIPSSPSDRRPSQQQSQVKPYRVEPPTSQTYPPQPPSTYNAAPLPQQSPYLVPQNPPSVQKPPPPIGFTPSAYPSHFTPQQPVVSVPPQQTQAPPPPPPPSSSQAPYSAVKNVINGPSSHSKPKYLVDPSVQGGDYRSYTPGLQMGQTPMYDTQHQMNSNAFYPQNVYNASVPNAPLVSPPSGLYQQPRRDSKVFTPDQNMKVMTPVSHPLPQTPTYSPTSGSSAWNDPPVVNYSKWNPPGVQVNPAVPSAVTQPLPGAPQQSMNYNAPPMVPPSVLSNVPKAVGYSNAAASYQGQTVTPPPTGLLPSAPPIQEVKPKQPMPEEHIHIQTVFDVLRNCCYEKTNNTLMKKKLEDVARRLEVMYDTIRERKLSNETMNGLHQMVQCVQRGNYEACLNIHTQLASGPEFAIIASFMPGIRTLIQSAIQLNVYL